MRGGDAVGEEVDGAGVGGEEAGVAFALRRHGDGEAVEAGDAPRGGGDDDVLAGEVEAAVLGADQPVDGDLDAEAGVVEAGPGLGADAGAEALVEGAGEVAGQRPLRRVGPEAGLVQADDAGGGQRGDLERVRVGRQAEVGDDDAADRRGGARRGLRRAAAGSSRECRRSRRATSAARGGRGWRAWLSPEQDRVGAPFQRGDEAVDRARRVADLLQQEEGVPVDLGVRPDRGEGGVGGVGDGVKRATSAGRSSAAAVTASAARAAEASVALTFVGRAALAQVGEDAAQLLERGVELGRHVLDGLAGEEGVGGLEDPRAGGDEILERQRLHAVARPR